MPLVSIFLRTLKKLNSLLHMDIFTSLWSMCDTHVLFFNRIKKYLTHSIPSPSSQFHFPLVAVCVCFCFRTVGYRKKMESGGSLVLNVFCYNENREIPCIWLVHCYWSSGIFSLVSFVDIVSDPKVNVLVVRIIVLLLLLFIVSAHFQRYLLFYLLLLLLLRDQHR